MLLINLNLYLKLILHTGYTCIIFHKFCIIMICINMGLTARVG